MTEGHTELRYTVSYSGHVQGVGFRYTTRSIAGRYAVAGYVQNLPDGRVELVAEGTRGELDGLLAEIRERFLGQIRDEKRDVRPATGEYREFAIRH